jgi:Protein of unknown function with PCYCGC motif
LSNRLRLLMTSIRGLNLSKSIPVLPAVAAVMMMGLITAGCSTSGATENTHGLDLAPIADMPDAARGAGGRIAQAYQLAVTHESFLREIPCYCGCNTMGHRSNFDCYVAGLEADGRLQFDEHAVDCAVCVNITHDALRLYAQGKSVPEIRILIDAQYSKFGPSTRSTSRVWAQFNTDLRMP